MDSTRKNIVSYIIEGNPKLRLLKSDLSKIFSNATAQILFLFYGKVCGKNDGVGMGSPVAPVMANRFLGHYEELWLNMYKGPSIHFYSKYVDDTSCLFNNDHEALLFFEFLNSHDSITLLWKRS